MRFCFLLAILATVVIAEPSYLSFPSDISWKSMESPHFHIIYREGQNEFARRTLRAAERAHALLSPIFPEAPATTSIVLADFSDSLNGYSLGFPYSHFVIFAAPPDSMSELSSLDNWLDSVVLHEYAHTLHLYPANGAWKWLRTIFGTTIVPNGMMPAHLHEGIATLFETEFSRGGRGRSPFFHMMTRKAVSEKVWGNDFLPPDLLDGSYSDWPHGTSPYYFGYYFYDYLWRKKGHKGIYDLTLSASSNWPYLINLPFEAVFGASIPDLWKEITSEQNQKQELDLTQFKKEKNSQLSYLTKTKFTKKELALSNTQQRAAFLSSRPGKDPQLEIIDSSSGKPLKEYPIRFSGAGGLCWKEEAGSDLFVLSTSHQEDFYTTNRISLFNGNERKTTELRTPEGPIDHVHEFSCSPDHKSILVYQESSGNGKLTLFEGDIWTPSLELHAKFSWVLPKNTWISSVSIGKSRLFLLREGNETSVYEWNPPNPPSALGNLEGHAYGLHQTGNEIYLISAPSGRDEIWRLDSNRKKIIKAVSVSGGINSFVPSSSRFFISSYEHGGFDIATASVLAPENGISLLRGQTASLPEERNSDWEEKEYSPASYLVPRTWIPSALFVPYGFQLAAWIPMFDLSQKHFYDLNLGVDKRDTNEGSQMLPNLSGSYGYRFGKSSTLQIGAYFSPGFLVISQSFFKSWGSSLSYGRRLGNLPLQGKVSALLRKIESSDLGPANQSVGLGLQLGWTSEKTRVDLAHQQFIKGFGSFDNYFSSTANFETAIQSPFWKSALWALSLRQGYTEGTPLYNSFFEGGGEILFSQGRGFFLNRGYLQGSFAARRIFGGNLEFRFPISRVDRGIGLWPAFLQNLSGALVLDTTSFDRGPASIYPKNWLKDFLWSTGFELKSQWKFFYYLPTQLRFGVYRGLSLGGEPFYFTIGAEASL